MSEYKEHVKLFKSGKLWVSALVGTFLSAGVLGLNTANAHADDVQTTNNEDPSIVQQGSTTTDANTVTLDAPAQTTTASQTSAASATSATSQAAASQAVSDAVSTQAVTTQATSAAVSSQATADSTVSAQTTATATSTAAPVQTKAAVATTAATPKYADGTYQTDTSNAYRKASDTTQKSTMQSFMGTTGTIQVNGATTTLTLPAKNTTNADMIQNITLDGVTGVRSGDNFVFNVPTADLDKTLTGVVKVYVAALDFNETQDYVVILDLSQVAPYVPATSETTPDSNGSTNSETTTPESNGSTTSETGTTDSQTTQNRKLQNGTFDISATYLKPNSTEVSPGMSRSLLSGASVTINGDRAQLKISATSSTTAAMIANMTVNGVTGVKDGSSWTFDLPTDSLSSLLNGSVTISVPGFSETQNFGINLDISAIPTAETTDPESNGSTGSETTTPESNGSTGSETTNPESNGSTSSETTTPESNGSTGSETTNPESNSSTSSETTTPESNGSTSSETTTPESNGSTGSETTNPESNGSTSSETVTPESNGSTGSETVTPESNGSTGSETVTPESNGSTGSAIITPESQTQGSQSAATSQTLGSTTATEQLNNTTVAKQAGQKQHEATLPNTGSDSENVLTGLGVLIGTLGMGGLLKKRH
ncbi:LPXTG-motif cell wall-anchored protein [Weissella uvarum]|uniref:KxYKxGKxW signal peptide domain-containing protein n=1 Tax=Weissella uvarum TaxID=1479233 RepID=UPI001961BE84|nr:KxYKxGKxW signal peptide domain-containing protein [Weissella uvarum]MBM7616554.1 LPXTG-motif cell wall-anchored protein [Weissella uvarum]MCM0594986.1 KxYKxGKxW signal peptide domain-containing protein [Weissella uvarum]